MSEDKKPKKQFGVSSYGKDKRKTLAELDAAGDIDSPKNPIDRVQEQLNRENDEKKGITQRIRNIFGN